MFKVKKTFSWAHRHVDVVEYQEGTEHAFVDADLIRVGQSEGWIEAKAAEATEPTEPVQDDVKADKPAQNKARKAAPENKGE